ncbi:MAG: crotonase/enoyl-CoA hydratase family protein [Woeseia sp.]|nr:crotonase/enoyl-CoA hydratase family protein [Woeseia sp.]MBT8095934.1 crotonase/enoyl-CoA hydratase family protein [Woeseia sp.]NNE61080.1 crotonase/enoyl-CoA hydratase family protein [Woeseia sp.]NNL53760.1 crotonase/enoyl-CoA hydratase family protein [Woeseia sp.]
MSEPIRVTIENHVAVVTLTRPEKRNAINLEMFEALSTAGQDLAQQKAVRAVVLTGEGDHFCAGIDTSVFTNSSPDELVKRMQPLAKSPANLFQHAAYVWRELPVPVIAALEGAVFGGGLQIAMGADVRLAAPDTRCSVMEIRWGIIPDMSLTTTMRHAVRLDHLRELTYTGRIVEADEAQRIGILTRICDDSLAAAEEVAAEIASRSPDAIRAAKKLLNVGYDATETDALRAEAEIQLGVLGRSNQREAIMANAQKRAPEFKD